MIDGRANLQKTYHSRSYPLLLGNGDIISKTLVEKAFMTVLIFVPLFSFDEKSQRDILVGSIRQTPPYADW